MGGGWRGVPVLRWLITTTEGVWRGTGPARQVSRGGCRHRVVSEASSVVRTGSAAAPFCAGEAQKDPGFGVLTFSWMHADIPTLTAGCRSFPTSALTVPFEAGPIPEVSSTVILQLAQLSFGCVFC